MPIKEVNIGAATPKIEICGLVKWFGTQRVLDGIDLDVKSGEVVVVVGPSGSGKSTLLNCINFLEPFQQGTIRIDGHWIGIKLTLKRVFACASLKTSSMRFVHGSGWCFSTSIFSHT